MGHPPRGARRSAAATAMSMERPPVARPAADDALAGSTQAHTFILGPLVPTSASTGVGPHHLMSTAVTPAAEWKRWIYVEWNRKLAHYFLAPREPEDRDVPIERIAATPEELARVANVDRAHSPAVLEVFVNAVRRELRPGQ